MFKSVIFIVNTILLILFNIAANEVNVKHTAPKRVEEGNSFIVNVEINKGNTNGYAKYQVLLPSGVTAEQVDAANSKCSIEGNKIKFVWVALPKDQVINLSYKVVLTDENIKEIALGGTFAYLKDNERQTVDAPVNTIAIGKVESNIPVIKEPIVEVSREIKALSNNKYKVTININAQHVTGFAKIQDEIPAGTQASIDVSEDAVFTPVASKVKFVWMNFPEDKPNIKVSYFIDGSNNEQPTVSGVFAYLFDGQTIKAPIQSKMNAIALNTEPSSSKISTSSEAIKDTPDTIEQETTTSASIESQPKKVAPKKATIETNTPQDSSSKLASTSSKQDLSLPLSKTPEIGIVYKVQIMAGHLSVDTDSYFSNKYNFNSEVGIDLHQGWHKYITGHKKNYQDARDLRNGIRSNYNFRGPFVVAYNDGERITVQEALMATNQKWVP